MTSYCEPTGFNCGVEDEAVLKRTVMRHAEQTVILMDSSKVDVKNTYAICTLADADVIILAQGSMARMEEELRRQTGLPVYSSPRLCAEEIQVMCEKEG